MTVNQLVDTHCHLNFHKFANDRAAVVARAADNGVSRMIVPAIDIESCLEAIALTEQYAGVYCALGVHPNSTASLDPHSIKQIRDWSQQPKVLAIGEIGLDYYWEKTPKDRQTECFEQQLALAAELELPVIIHNREASDDVLAILEAWIPTLPESLRQRPGVLHSFSGTATHADRALSLGFYLGFTGPITFKKADELRAIARQVPRHCLLIETDAPFLSPDPYRGKRNEPANVRFVNDMLAKLHSVTSSEMAQLTSANAELLFALPALLTD